MKLKDLRRVGWCVFYEKKLLLQLWVVFFLGFCYGKEHQTDLKWHFSWNTKWFDRFLSHQTLKKNTQISHKYQKIRSKVPEKDSHSHLQRSPDLTCHRPWLQIFLAFGSWLECHQTYTRRRRRNWSFLFPGKGRWFVRSRHVCYEGHPDWQIIVIQCDSGKYVFLL